MNIHFLRLKQQKVWKIYAYSEVYGSSSSVSAKKCKFQPHLNMTNSLIQSFIWLTAWSNHKTINLSSIARAAGSIFGASQVSQDIWKKIWLILLSIMYNSNSTPIKYLICWRQWKKINVIKKLIVEWNFNLNSVEQSKIVNRQTRLKIKNQLLNY